MGICKSNPLWLFKIFCLFAFFFFGGILVGAGGGGSLVVFCFLLLLFCLGCFFLNFVLKIPLANSCEKYWHPFTLCLRDLECDGN